MAPRPTALIGAAWPRWPMTAVVHRAQQRDGGVREDDGDGHRQDAAMGEVHRGASGPGFQEIGLRGGPAGLTVSGFAVSGIAVSGFAVSGIRKCAVAAAKGLA